MAASQSRGLLFGLGGLGLGYGLYAASVHSDVSKYEAEAAQVARMVVNEKKTLTSTSKAIGEVESSIKSLEAKEVTALQTLSEVEGRLEEARQQVQKLEQEYTTHQGQLEKIRGKND